MEIADFQYKDKKGKWQITTKWSYFLAKKMTKGSDNQMHDAVRIKPDMAMKLREELKRTLFS